MEHDPNAIIIIHSDHGFDYDVMKKDIKGKNKRTNWSNLSYDNMTHCSQLTKFLKLYKVYGSKKLASKFI